MKMKNPIEIVKEPGLFFHSLYQVQRKIGKIAHGAQLPIKEIPIQ